LSSVPDLEILGCGAFGPVCLSSSLDGRNRPCLESQLILIMLYVDLTSVQRPGDKSRDARSLYKWPSDPLRFNMSAYGQMSIECASLTSTTHHVGVTSYSLAHNAESGSLMEARVGKASVGEIQRRRGFAQGCPCFCFSMRSR
jgi:hypothetical protein